MHKEKFLEPTIEVIKIDYSDIVTESGCCDICDNYDCGGQDGKSCCQPKWAG